jgi:hypothetical protein
MSFVFCDMNSVKNYRNGNSFIHFIFKLTFEGFFFGFFKIGFVSKFDDINSFCKLFYVSDY